MSDQCILEAIKLFREYYDYDPDTAVYAPGRVNLIGEHVDYNGGFVLPLALPYKTVIVGNRTSSDKCNVVTFGGTLPPCSFEVNDKLAKGNPEWANYVKGTIYYYLKELPTNNIAFDIAIYSNVPMGSGLSSSAALEVAMATFLETMFGLETVSKVEKALRCQKAEHNFADTPCGIMDQFISAMGQQNNLLLIDCRSNSYELVPFNGGNNADSPIILVTNSKVKHNLSGSEYPLRVQQCNAAVAELRKKYPDVKQLRDATMDMLEDIKSALLEVVFRRAKHCILEDQRTLGAVSALKSGDFATVGKLMTESHRSLQHDYEVSCVELDALVDIALQVPGVYGSRMTGGGFGGCTVTLVKRSAVSALKEKLLTEYTSKFPDMRCECYEAVPSAGADEIDLQKIYNEMDAEDCQPLATWRDWVMPTAIAAVAVTLSAAYLIRKLKF